MILSGVSRNLQLVAFLGAYFVTTVAGNLISASPFAQQSLAASSSSDRFLRFPHTFTVGYWLLLLCPFVIAPVIVALLPFLSEYALVRWMQIPPATVAARRNGPPREHRGGRTRRFQRRRTG